MDAVTEIKAKLSIEDIVAEYVQLNELAVISKASVLLMKKKPRALSLVQKNKFGMTLVQVKVVIFLALLWKWKG